MIYRREHDKANVTSLVGRTTRFAFLAWNASRHIGPVIDRIALHLGPLPAAYRDTRPSLADGVLLDGEDEGLGSGIA